MTDLEAHGTVLLCNLPPREQSPDVRESVRAFTRHSAMPVWVVNLRQGFLPSLRRLRPRAIVVHYSCFYAASRLLGPEFRAWIAGNSDAAVVTLMQDEQAYTRNKLDLVDELGVDVVFTCLLGDHAQQLYGRTTARRILSCYPGYVGERLLEASARLTVPDERRPIDVGYRGRRPPAHWGEVAREKEVVGTEFARRAAGRGLHLDIEVGERKRLRGEDWYRFVASCRGMLGTESGASVLDVEGVVPAPAERIGAGARSLDPDVARALERTGGRYPYRTISPRHLEAAAFGVCQILFPGEYAGVLRAGKHYLALEKDFSNLDAVLTAFSDTETRLRIADAARRDLVDSGALSYATFVGAVDAELFRLGVEAPEDRSSEHWRVQAVLDAIPLRRTRTLFSVARSYARPARELTVARARKLTPHRKR